MEKKLELIKRNNDYLILFDDISLEIINKKIKSEELYNKIYSKIPETDNGVSITLTTKLTDKEDTIIYRQLVALFKSIDDEVNKQLSLKQK